MADVLEDPKKKKASFGDSAAAATDPNVTQLKVGKPGDFPVNPDGTPMEKKAPAMAPGLGALPPTTTSTPSQPQAQSPLANQTAMYVAGAQAANPQPSVMAINPPGAMARPVPMASPEFIGPGAMLGKPGDFAPRQPSAQSAMATGADAQQVRSASAAQSASQVKPMGAEDGMMPGTRAVMSGFADDAKTMMAKGQYGALAGQLGRATAAMPLAVAEDVLRPALGLAQPIFQGAANAVKTFVTGDSSPAQFGALNLTGAAQPGAAPAAPSAPAAPAPISAGRSSASFAATDPRRVDLGPSSATGVLGQVARSGDSYSGTNVAGDIAVNGKPAGGTVTMLGGNPGDLSSAERMAMDQRAHDINMQSIKLRQQLMNGGAPAEGGFQPAQARHSGNDWQARNNLRNLEVSASSITNKGDRRGPSAAQAAYYDAVGQDRAAMMGADPGTIARGRDAAAMQGDAMRLQGVTAQTAAQMMANGQRNAIDQQRLGLEATAQGFKTRAAQSLEAAQQAVMGANTPEEQAAANKRLAALMGKDQSRMQVVNLPDSMSADGFQKLSGGQAVLRENADGTVTRVPVGDQAAKPARAPGTVSEVNGKRAVWDGSKWIPQ